MAQRLLSDDDIKLLIQSGDLDQNAMIALEKRSPEDALAATMLGAKGSDVMGSMPMPPFGVGSRLGGMKEPPPIIPRNMANPAERPTFPRSMPSLTKPIAEPSFPLEVEATVRPGATIRKPPSNLLQKGNLTQPGPDAVHPDPPNLLRTSEGAAERVRGGVQNDFRGVAHIEKPTMRRELPSGYKPSSNPAQDSVNFINRSNSDANAAGDMGEVERIMAELAALLGKR